MHPGLAQVCSLPEGSFRIAIASYASLMPVIKQILSKERRKILYVSGNYPPVLTAVDRRHGRFSVRRALTAYQYLTILSEAYETCIIVEHDPSVYSDAPDVAETVGRLCREKAEEAAAVLMIAPRWDAYVAQMTPVADAVMHLEEGEKQAAAVHRRSATKNKTDTGKRSAQRHLWDGDWQ